MSRERNRLRALCAGLVVSGWASTVAAGDLGVPIVFVSRDLGAAPEAGSRPSAIERARRGSLVVRETTGTLRTLVDPGMPGAPADVLHPDVSHDGSRIVFALSVVAPSDNCAAVIAPSHFSCCGCGSAAVAVFQSTVTVR